MPFYPVHDPTHRWKFRAMMPKTQTYQFDYSKIRPQAVFDQESRTRKAHTILSVLKNQFSSDLHDLTLLDIGCSTGIMADALAPHFKKIVGIDIDTNAIQFARSTFHRSNLEFIFQDCLCLGFKDDAFDLIVCAHVYEHVPDPESLLSEVHRVLRPGGICYFAAGNRLAVREPHYGLPFLSYLPQAAANAYLRWSRKGSIYYEKHRTVWGLRRLVRGFIVIDYTQRLIETPALFGFDYLLKEGTRRHRLAKFAVRHFYWLCPTYVWLLQKDAPLGRIPPSSTADSISA
jgi:2-polyprenyl-3-methyl-5-hydroxy-6-metoxy-1,4-benzoquinol methylase